MGKLGKQINSRFRDYTRPFKFCSQCLKELPLSEDHFYRSKISKDGFGSVCIACVKRRYDTKIRFVLEANREWLNIQKGNTCSECHAHKEPLLLDWHHIHGKDCQVSHLILRPREVIQQEIDKCIILCAYCHFKRHYQPNSTKVRLGVRGVAKKYLEAIRLSGCCAACGFADPEYPGLLSFHHVDPSLKQYEINELDDKGGLVWLPILEAEVRKCELLCIECHRKVHDGRSLTLRYRTNYDAFRCADYVNPRNRNVIAKLLEEKLSFESLTTLPSSKPPAPTEGCLVPSPLKSNKPPCIIAAA